MIRRLDPIADEYLVREALSWSKDAPRWMRDADEVWGGSEDAESYLSGLLNQPTSDFGIFNGDELIGVVTLTLAAKGVYNTHLMAKPGADVNLIVSAVAGMKRQLLESGALELWSWPAKVNRGVRRILEAIGMRPDGVEMIKGQSHGQSLTWVRYSVRSQL